MALGHSDVLLKLYNYTAMICHHNFDALIRGSELK